MNVVTLDYPKESAVIVSVVQTKGGAGASTVRCAMALVANAAGMNVLLVGDEDHAAILGLPVAGVIDMVENITLVESLDKVPQAGIDAADLIIVAHEMMGVEWFDGRETHGHVADKTIVVVRADYLALRRATQMPVVAASDGFVFVEEAGRSLGVRDVQNVLGVKCLATVPVRSSIARAIDAGVMVTRLHGALARPIRELLQRLDALNEEQTALSYRLGDARPEGE